MRKEEQSKGRLFRFCAGGTGTERYGRKDFAISRKEIKTTYDIRRNLEEMIDVVKKRGLNLDQAEKDELLKHLRRIQRDENILLSDLETIRKHVKAYKVLHKKDIPEIEKRLAGEKNRKQRRHSLE